MNWIPITIADLEDAKVSKLVTALRTKALAAGQTDPTPRLTQAVVDRIRRKIAANRANRVDADVTKIPASLKTMASDFILADLKGRLEIPLESDEKDRLSRWDTDLKAIANGEPIEQPDDAIDPDVQVGGNSPSITEGRREARNARAGL